MAKWCKGCDNPISENRLKVVPNAVHCVVCQEKEDSKMTPALPRTLNRLGSAGKFERDDVIVQYRKTPVATHGLAAAISGGYGF